MPLVGSTITPIVVFLPLISITGVTGVFFRALAVTVAVALLTSLALALTWTPTLSHYFIREQQHAAAPKHDARHRDGSPRTMAHVGSCFAKCSRFHQRWLSIALVLALVRDRCVLIAASYLCYQLLGLRPAAGDGRRRLHPRLHHAGRDSLAETNRVITHVEQILRKTPEVESTSRRTGLQLGLAAVTEANTGDISVKLKARPQPRHRRSDRRCARQDQEGRSRRSTSSSRSCCRT